MVWQKNKTNTLGSAVDDLDLTALTAETYNVFLIHMIADGNIMGDFTIDNNTSSDDYARRSAGNGVENTAGEQSSIDITIQMSQVSDGFTIMYGMNIASEAKLFIGQTMKLSATGAGTAPDMSEFVGKVDTTTNSGQFTSVNVNNDRTGDYAINSNITALSTD